MSVFVGRKIDDEALVEEITHDVLMAAFNSLPNFNHQSAEFSWICGIAKHKIIDYYRKKKLKTILFSASPVFEEIADKALSPEKDVLKNELKKEIKKTFDEIRAGYKKILRLKYLDGLRVAQIAKLMGLTPKSVESRLHRAKKEFRASWNYDTKTAKEVVEDRRTDRR
ncbi:sigma-70 family RNA polymerase sigma factor [Candidatus Shapirobacteria bacterium]|nr:sigma-70 family RNA polymerase sigma factor [Candidatus Shapirobacteria bacterium]